jgi:hypothetical protein
MGFRMPDASSFENEILTSPSPYPPDPSDTFRRNLVVRSFGFQ